MQIGRRAAKTSYTTWDGCAVSEHTRVINGRVYRFRKTVRSDSVSSVQSWCNENFGIHAW